MEVADVFACQSVQFSHFENACDCLLESNLVAVVEFHEEDVEEVDDDEAVDGVVLDDVSNQEVAHDRKIDQEQHGVADRYPPVDARVLIRQRVEVSLNDQCIECALLYSRLNSDIWHTKENTVHHNETLGGRVRECQQSGVHSVGTKNTLLLDSIDGGVDVVLRYQ
jgi:hypothetical protein